MGIFNTIFGETSDIGMDRATEVLFDFQTAITTAMAFTHRVDHVETLGFRFLPASHWVDWPGSTSSYSINTIQLFHITKSDRRLWARLSAEQKQNTSHDNELNYNLCSTRSAGLFDTLSDLNDVFPLYSEKDLLYYKMSDPEFYRLEGPGNNAKEFNRLIHNCRASIRMDLFTSASNWQQFINRIEVVDPEGQI